LMATLCSSLSGYLDFRSLRVPQDQRPLPW